MASARRGLALLAPLHVLGSGSIGLLFASSLRRAFPTYPLTMLLRPAHESRLHPRSVVGSDSSQLQQQQQQPKHSIMASLIAHDGTVVPVELPAEIILNAPQQPTFETEAGADPASIRNLILSTKAPDAAAALRSIVHRLDRRGADVVILGNGAMAVRDELRDVLDGVGRRVATWADEDGGDGGVGDGNDGSCSAADDDGDGAVRLVLASTTHGAHRGLSSSSSNDEKNFVGGGSSSNRSGGAAGDATSDTVYRVVHAGLGNTYVQSRPFAELFDAAGLRASYATPTEMYVLLWKKLAANCAINPLTALRGCRNGDLLRTDDVKTMDEIVKEVAAVAAAEVRTWRSGRDSTATLEASHPGDGTKGTSGGDDLLTAAGEELGYDSLRSFVDGVMRDTADNTSSMLQDVIARRHPTEVSYLNGYVARIGLERHGLEAPANRDVCDRVERLTAAFVGS